MPGRRTIIRVAVVAICLLGAAIGLLAQSSSSTGSGTTSSTPASKKPAASTSAKNKPATKSAPRKTTNANSAQHSVKTTSVHKKVATTTSASKVKSSKSSVRRRAHYKPPTARSIKLTKAFLASEQLRPMAQQLAAATSSAAYAGVLHYAQSHPGEGAAAAYLALGHAYMQDHRYADAIGNFNQAKRCGEALADYADYLAAQAAIQSGHAGDSYSLLDHFADRYPDSIFAATAPVLLASAHLQQNDAQGALQVLIPLANSPQSQLVNFRYTLARAYQLAGDIAHAAPIFRDIYATQPFTSEASQSAAQLQAMGAPLSAAERKIHADALFNAKRYGEAGTEYNAIGRNNPQLSPADRDALTLYAAVCDFKLKQLSRRDIEKLPETNDDTAALKLYMLAELSRDEDDRPGHDAIIAQFVPSAFPPAAGWKRRFTRAATCTFSSTTRGRQSITTPPWSSSFPTAPTRLHLTGARHG